MAKLKIGVTAVLLAFLLWKVHPREIIETLRNASFQGLLLAVALGAIMLMIRWWKWHVLIKGALQTPSPKESLVSLLGGMAFALVTPARVGEISRALFFEKGKKTQVGALTFLDRVVDLLVVMIYATVGATSQVSFKFRVVLALTMGLLALIVIRFDSFLKLLRRFFKEGRLSERIASIEQVERNLQGRVILQNFLLSCCLTFVDLLTFYVLVRCFVEIQFSVILFVFPLVLLMNVAPITLSGLGLREGTAIALLALFGVSRAAAFNATFLSYLLNSVVPALVGAVYAKNMKLGFSLRSDSIWARDGHD